MKKQKLKKGRVHRKGEQQEEFEQEEVEQGDFFFSKKKTEGKDSLRIEKKAKQKFLSKHSEKKHGKRQKKTKEKRGKAEE